MSTQQQSEDPFAEYSKISDSKLRVGVEVEFPELDDDKESLTSPGVQSNEFQSKADSYGWPSSWGEMHYDGTVGAEIVNPEPLELVDAHSFFAETIEIAEEEFGAIYEPTGMLKGGSTAGLHIHLSSLTDTQAKKLAEFSKQPWMQVFACTAVAETGSPDMPVFRGERYCNLVDDLHGSRYNVVNARGGGHYEWRLPEPMTPTHFNHICTFLRIFEDDPEQAKEYVMHVLQSKEDDVTSIARAKKIGVPTDFDNIPLVSRSQHPQTESFYNDISRGSGTPHIYRVTYEGQEFYAFDTENEDIEQRTYRVGGVGYQPVEFGVDSVFYADDLSEADDEDITDPILSAVENRAEYQSHGDRNETEATKTLKKVLDKDF